jgi:hypothetical protein
VTGAIFEHAGQICSAGSRLVIEKPEFTTALSEALGPKARAISLGHGLRSPDMGPVNSALQQEKIIGFLDRARARGAEFICGGKACERSRHRQGLFHRTHDRCQPAPPRTNWHRKRFSARFSPCRRPMMPNTRLRWPTAARFGLVAGIFTGDFSKAHQLARDIDAGQVYINEYFRRWHRSPLRRQQASRGSAARRASKASRATARSRASPPASARAKIIGKTEAFKNGDHRHAVPGFHQAGEMPRRQQPAALAR